MRRFDFVIRRLLQTIPLLLGVTLLVFLLIKITPGDPARLILGPRATNQQVEQLHKKLGLDDPLPQQYARYVVNVAQGDLGTSIRQEIPVSEVIRKALPVTLALLVLGSLVSFAIAVPLSVVAARKPDRVTDHSVRAVTLIGLTMPSYWVGILLLVLIALPTGWFPVAGYGSGFGNHLLSLVLPSITLGIALAPIVVRSLRSSLIAVRQSDYIAMARAVGVGPGRLVRRHELPNAILPSITLAAVSIGWALFGVVVIENTFALPGLGSAMLDAVNNRDFPVVQGITLVFALAVILVNLITDILYVLVDPRVAIE